MALINEGSFRFNSWKTQRCKSVERRTTLLMKVFLAVRLERMGSKLIGLFSTFFILTIPCEKIFMKLKKERKQNDALVRMIETDRFLISDHIMARLHHFPKPFIFISTHNFFLAHPRRISLSRPVWFVNVRGSVKHLRVITAARTGRWSSSAAR